MDEQNETESNGNRISRRSWIDIFLGGSLIAWMGSVLYPIVSYLKPPEVAEIQVSRVTVGPAADFPPNESQIIRFGRKPVILLRTEKGEFRAFFATCTHLDCTVQLKKDEGIIWCACHNGKYDLTGRNISGPPPRPLDQLQVQVTDDGMITVYQV